MDENSVVVSQEDAQYIIERQRREIRHIQREASSAAWMAVANARSIVQNACRKNMSDEHAQAIRRYAQEILDWCDEDPNASS